MSKMFRTPKTKPKSKPKHSEKPASPEASGSKTIAGTDNAMEKHVDELNMASPSMCAAEKGEMPIGEPSERAPAKTNKQERAMSALSFSSKASSKRVRELELH